MLNCLIYGQKTPLKIGKIGHISVRDFASTCFTKCVITFAIFKFSESLKNKFLPYVGGQILRETKKLKNAKVITSLTKLVDTKTWPILSIFRGF